MALMSKLPELDPKAMESLARQALAEDLGEVGDITSKHIVRIDQPGRGTLLSKSEGILAGSAMAEMVFKTVDRSLEIEWSIIDGGELTEGAVVAEISGRARAILAAERVALNFLQHLSGVATQAARFVEICSPHGVRVLCTRKTIPGLRDLQRHSVVVGGGSLHRAGLFDEILIKTNHLRLSGGITEALKRTKANPNLKVEVEVTSIEEIEEAIEAGADEVLLDNASIDLIKQAVEITRDRVLLEISGGVTLDNVADIAALKPDSISVGGITHSVTAIDLSLRVEGPFGPAPR
jgi:nicotinate-nucleotide pyrophosphorylase (carboxylating)